MTIPRLLPALPLPLAVLFLIGAAPAIARTEPSSTQAAETPRSDKPTRILDKAAARRLLGSKGLTLQWIDWNTRGTASIADRAGRWTLRGAQYQTGGPGRLFLDGVIREIGKDYFLFHGTISITDTPDPGRTCEMTREWRFAITQDRPYYRLREFEWCDELTDYIDIYF